MDLFKKLKDWINGGNQAPAKQPDLLRQQKVAGTMPQVLNAKGQQDWIKKNAPLVTPTIKLAPTPSVPTINTSVGAMGIKLPPAPVIPSPIAQPKPALTPVATAPKPVTPAPVAKAQPPIKQLLPVAPISTAMLTPPNIQQMQKSAQVNNATAKVAEDKQIATSKANKVEAVKFIDKTYQGNNGVAIGGRDIQTSTIKGKDGSARTYGQIMDEFNNMDRLSQDNYMKSLDETVHGNSRDFGDQATAQRRDEASLVKTLLEERGSHKSASLIAGVGGLGRDMVKSFTGDMGAMGNFQDEVLSMGMRGSAKDRTDVIDKNLRDGKITREEYAKQMNQEYNANEPLVDNGVDKGITDRILRLAGLVANTYGNAIPLRSLESGAAKSVIGMTAKEAAIEYGKDLADNAVVSGIGALQEKGIDTTPADIAIQTAVGGLSGVAMRGVGDIAGTGIRAVNDLINPRNTIENALIDNPTLRSSAIDTAGRDIQTPRAEAVAKGIVTPETKSLPLSERIATALNYAKNANTVTDTQSIDINGSVAQDVNGNPINTQPVSQALDQQIIQPETQIPQGIVNPNFAAQDLAVQNIDPNIINQPAYRIDTPNGPDSRIEQVVQQAQQNGIVDPQILDQLRASSTKLFGDERVNIPQDLRGSTNEPLLGRFEDNNIDVRANQTEPNATYFHEALHRAISEYTSIPERRELLADVRERYGDQALLDEAGKKGYSGGVIEAAEERLADDFMDFAAQRSSSTNLSERIKTIFTDLVERLKTAFGQGNLSERFMKDLFDGNFARRVQNSNRETPMAHPELQELDSQYKSLQERYDSTPEPTARGYINQALAANRVERLRLDSEPKYRKDEHLVDNDSVHDAQPWTDDQKTKAREDLVRSIDESDLAPEEKAKLLEQVPVDKNTTNTQESYLKLGETNSRSSDASYQPKTREELQAFVKTQNDKYALSKATTDSPVVAKKSPLATTSSRMTEADYNTLVDQGWRNKEQAKLVEGQAEAKRKFEESTVDPALVKKRAAAEKLQQVTEAIERGFKDGPRHTVEKITDTVAELGFMPRKKVEALVQKYAIDNNYDISTGRAHKTMVEEVGSLADENGKIKPVDEIQPSDEILSRIKRAGIKNALPYSTYDPEDMVRQMVYKHDDGTAGAYFEYRTPDGKWQKGGLDAVDIKSPQSGVKLAKLQSNAEVNAEVKRAYESGTSAQYIWRENDAGVNSEFVREFDAAMGDGSKLDKVDSNKIVGFDPDRHYIEAGKVVEADTGKVLGNYIEITPEGVNMFAGRQRISLNYNELDLTSIREMKTSGLTWSTEGIIDRITGNKKHTNSVDYFKDGGHKTKEALMQVMVEEPRTAQRNIIDEDNALGTTIDSWEKSLNKVVKRPKRAEARRDAVYVIEPATKRAEGEAKTTIEQRLEEYARNYGQKAADNIKQYDVFMRGVYDNLLVRMNNERLAIGQPAIKRRFNYITHIAEMADGGILRQSIQGVNNMIGGDVMTDTRGALPSSITGTTGAFKPKSKYNPFSKERLADNKPLNPFDPLRVYSNLALQNIHMTKPITMNRSIETTIRGLSEAKQEMSSSRGIQYVADMVEDVMDKSRKGEATADEYQTLSRKLFGLTRVFGNIDGVQGFQRLLRKAVKDGTVINPDQRIKEREATTFENAATLINDQLATILEDVDTLNNLKKEADGLQQFVGIIQEHTNKLAGKTNWMVRGLKDLEKGKGTDLALTIAKAAQQHAALTSIVGSASSALAQLMSTPLVMGTTRPQYQFEGLKLMGDKALMKKSDALWIRYKESILAQKTRFQKTMDVGGLPLMTIERGVMKWTFASKYAEGIGKGLNERQAIKYAERFIGDMTSWRDVASAPRAYDRPLPASLLQFTREVTQQYRGFWNRFTPAEKARTLIAVAVISNGMAAITGVKMGADPLTAAIETGIDVGGANDAGRDDDQNSPWAKTVRAGQNLLGEVVSSVPIASAAANTVWSKDDRAQIFGTDSTLGRYEGNMAMFTAAGNIVRGTGNLTSGNTDQAWKDYLKLFPMGSQAQKTAAGLQAMFRGYTTTSAGHIKASVDKSNPANWLIGGLFGPNAIVENRDAVAAGSSFSQKQTDWVEQLNKDGKPDAAQTYIKSIEDSRDQTAADKKAGVKNSDLSYDADSKVKFADGTWTEKDGKVVDKDGKLVTQYYKDKSKANKDKQSIATYDDFMLAYDLNKAAEVASTGNITLDKMKNLENQKKANETADVSVGLLTNSKDGYKDIPDWVKDHYYKKAGYSKADVEYAASATYSVDAKVDGYFRPIADSGDHTKLLDELYKGRVKGINDEYFATSTVIEQLYDEGYLTKSERTTLKAAQLSKAGKQIESKSGSSAKKKAEYTAADISKFVNGGGSDNYSAIAGILKATRSSAGTSGSSKISARSVQIRGLRAIVNSRKQSTKKRRLA